MTTASRATSRSYVQATLRQPKVEVAIACDRHLKNLSEYVDKNIDRSFQLADAAAAIGVSPTRLSHLFVEKTGIAYTRWIRQKGIQMASELLSIGGRPILDIAMSAGYSNVRTFQRSFKQITGLAPTGYRQLRITHILSQK